MGVVDTVDLAADSEMPIPIDPAGPVAKVYHGLPSPNVLCINFVPRGEECWPSSPLVEGQRVTVTSNRGQMLRVTSLDR